MKFDFKAAKDQSGPGVMYCSMLQGIPPLTIRGVVWYQGESDARDKNYGQDLTRMIEAWRARFRRPDMPFYMIQIAQTTYMGGMLNIWQCETDVMEHVPHTGLGPSNDLWDRGDAKKLRRDAQDRLPACRRRRSASLQQEFVALRAADIALKETYGVLQREVFGPAYLSHEIRDDRIAVKFQHVGAGLTTDDGRPPNWFEISADAPPAGSTRTAWKFVPAQARIVGNDTIEVWSDAAKSPHSIRFAWHPLARHNLYNAEGLPAMPFNAK